MIVREKKIPYTLRLPERLSRRLDSLTTDPGSSKTQIIVDAIANFLEKGGRPEDDERYAIRFDRISRQLARLERRSAFVSEALGLFIQHQLTAAAHEPPFEAATAHLGRRRYEAFLKLVWKRMSGLGQGPQVSPPIGQGEADPAETISEERGSGIKEQRFKPISSSQFDKGNASPRPSDPGDDDLRTFDWPVTGDQGVSL